MATIKKQVKQAAVRVWLWISPQVNNPRDCQASDWLVERLSESLPADQISSEIWKLARRSLALRFPGLDRPLGSCYHPRVADVLDVAYHYGKATQRILRRVASAAAEIVHAGEGLWSVVETDGRKEYTPPTARTRGAHISECPRLLGQLAGAVREGRAPAVEDIRPQFFESGWNETRAEEVRRDVEAKQKLAPIADLLSELKVSLFETEDPTLEASERWYDQCHCPNGRDTNSWFTDGRMTKVSSEELEERNGYFCGGGTKSYRIEGATFAFSQDFAPGNGGGGRGTYSVQRLYVWPGYDPAGVAAALKDALKK